MHIEKVFDVAILFREAGQFGNGEDEAIDVWIMRESNLFHIIEGAFNGSCEKVAGTAGAITVQFFPVRIEELKFDWS